jgi:hypothetical protein
MLFKTRFHVGIRDGSITVTYRAWQSARVTVGNSYRLGASGALEVDGVDHVTLGSIGDRDAGRAGFDDAEELVDMLRESSPKRLTSRSRVYRVSFRFVKRDDPRNALQNDASREAIDEVLERLERFDRASRHGSWTQRVLELIAKKPRTRAPDLAATTGRETARFKADVRKLKGLGLTISHEVGYELSSRGQATLAEMKRGRRS